MDYLKGQLLSVALNCADVVNNVLPQPKEWLAIFREP